MRVQVDAAQVHHPGQPGGVGDDELLGAAARWELELDGLDPCRPRGRRPLLEEGLPGRPVHVTLQDHRAASDAAQRAVRDGEVVPDDIQLGHPKLREIDLSRVGDSYFAAANLDDLLRIGHDAHDNWLVGEAVGWSSAAGAAAQSFAAEAARSGRVAAAVTGARSTRAFLPTAAAMMTAAAAAAVSQPTCSPGSRADHPRLSARLAACSRPPRPTPAR